ncbi:aldehyde dehydrogenase EutE [Clostridium swellfunianum]|uniref:aldehyde dehydrogenase family protein n=1 Tax=Clostridium swellfunianum TaxID=1367462 RepID=UPI00202F6CA1|nr:aldehyde dehydrogenase family protein [Clostridium swellfunianum]MCM0649234.1 aldehyde dehydrogenase EutE [Clostridium swellfunianum]
MSVNITEKDLQSIIEQVVKNISGIQGVSEAKQQVEALKEIKIAPSNIVNPESTSNYSKLPPVSGVFENMAEAIEAADKAQKNFIKKCNLDDRERIINAIRKMILSNKETLAKMVYDETKLGKYRDKLAKLELVAAKTPGVEDLKTEAFSGDSGLTIVENGAFGVIGAVTPVTNPIETILNNSIGMIAGGNTVVFNVHPSSKNSCAYVVELLNKTIVEAGGPANLVNMVRIPNMDTLKELTTNPKIRLLVGTGGPGLVKTLLQSGKKAIGAGAGNPPVIVDETADLEHAAKEIIKGASFDNNILCIAEKEVFVVDKAADELIFHMLNNGAYMLSKREVEFVMQFALEENVNKVARGCSLDNKREYHVAKDWVGKDASLFLEKLGVRTDKEVNLLIFEAEFDHPYVQLEQMMPVMPIVRVRNVDEAIDLAVEAEHGNRHTAMMHSKNVDNLTKFARAIGTTIFVKNASSLAGVGFEGEGYTTMSIAGPTGEGLTSAKNFTRKRRCVLAEGGFRIV